MRLTTRPPLDMDHDNVCWFSELTQSQPHNRLGRSHFYNKYIPQEGDKINRCTTDEIPKRKSTSPLGGRGGSLTQHRFSFISFITILHTFTHCGQTLQSFPLLHIPSQPSLTFTFIISLLSTPSLITYSFCAFYYLLHFHLTAIGPFSNHLYLLVFIYVTYFHFTDFNPFFYYIFLLFSFLLSLLQSSRCC